MKPSATAPTSSNKQETQEQEFLEQIQEMINDVVQGDEQPVLLGREGARIHMPPKLFEILTQATRALLSGQSVQVIAQGEEFTTQAAAAYLGCSRPYLISLLEEKKIPFHFVGTHRRIAFQDLQAYRKQRDKTRQEALQEISSLYSEQEYQ